MDVDHSVIVFVFCDIYVRSVDLHYTKKISGGVQITTCVDHCTTVLTGGINGDLLIVR